MGRNRDVRTNVLILSQRDFLTLPTIRSLDAETYRIFVMGPACSPVRFSRFHDGYFSFPGRGPNWDERLVKSVNGISERFAINAVIPLDLDSTVWISDNRHRLKVPSLPLSQGETLLRLHDKWELTKTLNALGIRYPKTVLVKTPDYLTDGVAPYPFMVKPLNLEAGKGIVRIDDNSVLDRYLATGARCQPFPVLAQRYVRGIDVGMSALAKDGKIVSWTIQRSSDSWVVELFADSEAYEAGARIAAKESYSGFFHIDFIKDAITGELSVLEFNPRVWSSVNASILNGYDFFGDAVALARGSDVPKRQTAHESYSKFRRSFILLLTKPFTVMGESSITRKDLFRVLTDPVPYFLLAVIEGVKRVFEKCRR